MPTNTRRGIGATLRRLEQNEVGTYGVLEVNGAEVAKTLELPWRDNHPQTSCVPAGTYDVVLDYSPHFNRDLWELTEVPGRSECKFHPANVPDELRGCIALGSDYGDFNGVKGVVHSVDAVAKFMGMYEDCGIFTLTILAPEGVSNAV